LVERLRGGLSQETNGDTVAVWRHGESTASTAKVRRARKSGPFRPRDRPLLELARDVQRWFQSLRANLVRIDFEAGSARCR
jgi:hypothetical protein